MTGKVILTCLHACLLLAGSITFGQSDTDVYLFSLHKDVNGEFHLYGAKYISGFNEGGYTDQPWFTPNGELLLSVRKSGDTQNDIYRLSFNTKKYRRLTQTKAFEYSPRIHPDEEHLTVLRKVEGEPLDQQVYSIDLRTGNNVNVSGNIRDIGYYTWMSPSELGLFRIDGDIHRLSYYNLDDGKSRRITSSIGRTLMTDKDGRLVYVHKFSEDFWYIKKYNPESSVIEIITQTRGKNEDFTIAPDGTYFMGSGQILYYFHPDHDAGWKPLADLSLYGIKHITRLAINYEQKQLVVVATKDSL